jgi:site-specific DNA-cytosine methylase
MGMLGYGETPTALHVGQVPDVQRGTEVRRLTPLECEPLQGLPDNWTRWLADGTEQSDSARYRQCGNAMALPVIEWIVRRLVAADKAQREDTAA